MVLEKQLAAANCGTPFDILGWHHTDEGAQIKVWNPNASKIAVYGLSDGKKLGEMQSNADSGLFQLALATADPVHYRLQVTTTEGEFSQIDPYQFTEQAYHAVHFVDHQPENLYKQLGAQLLTVDLGKYGTVEGTRFAVYAPNASSVALVGDFNWWDGGSHPMQRTSMGYWVLFVPGVKPGIKYKYFIKDTHGNSLPHKADPVGFRAEQYPSHASVVYDHNSYQWRDDAWMKRDIGNVYEQPMSVYEVHLGSWRKKNTESGELTYLTYRELAEQLIPYVKEMGYTHLEILPVQEHPFDGSWGYQPVGLFAPTSRFGDPDDFKAFVDACHQNELAVIIDWVPAHFPEDGHGLARFDGTHTYEYEDPRKGWHPDWNSCIYDFGKDTVRQFLVANALYWVDKFHIDGLRVDAVASMLYLDYSRNDGEWIPNVDGGNKNYEAISLLQWMNREVYQKFPHVITIAEESTSFPKVSRPIYDGGLGFGFKWNMGWMHDTLHYIAKDPAYRRYHHNEITFSMVYAFDENFVLPISHDEVVHGKGAMIRKMPGDEWQQAANLRLYASFMYAHPGKKLNFMGNEIAQSAEWNHDASLHWHLLEYEKHRGIQALYKALNHLYRQQPALHQLDCQQEGFEWIDHHNSEQSILSFVRKSKEAKEKIYVVSNFTPVPRDSFRLGVLDKGRYQVLLNTDDQAYWGSGFAVNEMLEAEDVAANERPFSVCLSLPPLASVYILHKA